MADRFDPSQLSEADQSAYRAWQQQFQDYLTSNGGAVPGEVTYALQHPEYLKSHPELQQAYDLVSGAGLPTGARDALKKYHTTWSGGNAGMTKNKTLWSHPETWAQLALGGALGGLGASAFMGGASATAPTTISSTPLTTGLGTTPSLAGSTAAGAGSVASGVAPTAVGTTGVTAAGGGAASELPTLASRSLTSGVGTTPSLAGSTAAGTGSMSAPGGGGNIFSRVLGGPFMSKYGKILTKGGGAFLGGLIAKKSQDSAMQRSPEELAALAGANRAAGSAADTSESLLKEGRPYIQQPASYYQTLLSGNRAAMANAVAAPTAAITETYRGAERGLERSGVRGAQRQVAAGELARQRASQIAGLTTGVQPMVADALGKLGSDVLGRGTTLANVSGNIYGNLLGEGYRNRVYARGEGRDTGNSIGQLIADFGDILWP